MKKKEDWEGTEKRREGNRKGIERKRQTGEGRDCCLEKEKRRKWRQKKKGWEWSEGRDERKGKNSSAQETKKTNLTVYELTEYTLFAPLFAITLPLLCVKDIRTLSSPFHILSAIRDLIKISWCASLSSVCLENLSLPDWDFGVPLKIAFNPWIAWFVIFKRVWASTILHDFLYSKSKFSNWMSISNPTHLYTPLALIFLTCPLLFFC